MDGTEKLINSGINTMTIHAPWANFGTGDDHGCNGGCHGTDAIDQQFLFPVRALLTSQRLTIPACEIVKGEIRRRHKAESAHGYRR